MGFNSGFEGLMQCTPSQLHLKFILILSCHLLLGLPSGRPRIFLRILLFQLRTVFLWNAFKETCLLDEHCVTLPNNCSVHFSSKGAWCSYVQTARLNRPRTLEGIIQQNLFVTEYQWAEHDPFQEAADFQRGGPPTFSKAHIYTMVWIWNDIARCWTFAAVKLRAL